GPLQRIVDRPHVLGRPIAEESMRRTGIGDDFFVGLQPRPKRRDLIGGDAGIRAPENAQDRNPNLAGERQWRETAWLRLKMPVIGDGAGSHTDARRRTVAESPAYAESPARRLRGTTRMQVIHGRLHVGQESLVR